MKKADPIVVSVLIASYLIYKMTNLIDNFADEVYFLTTCIGLAFLIFRLDFLVKRSWVASITLIIGYTFFACLAILYLYYWVLLGEKKEWIFQAFCGAILLTIPIIAIKHFKHVWNHSSRDSR